MLSIRTKRQSLKVGTWPTQTVLEVASLDVPNRDRVVLACCSQLVTRGVYSQSTKPARLRRKPPHRRLRRNVPQLKVRLAADDYCCSVRSKSGTVYPMQQPKIRKGPTVRSIKNLHLSSR